MSACSIEGRLQRHLDQDNVQALVAVSHEVTDQPGRQPVPGERALDNHVLASGHADLLRPVGNHSRLTVVEPGHLQWHDAFAVGQDEVADLVGHGEVAAVQVVLDQHELEDVRVDASPLGAVPEFSEPGRLANGRRA